MSVAFVGTTFSGANSVVPPLSRRSQAGRITGHLQACPACPACPACLCHNLALSLIVDALLLLPILIAWRPVRLLLCRTRLHHDRHTADAQVGLGEGGKRRRNG